MSHVMIGGVEFEHSFARPELEKVLDHIDRAGLQTEMQRALRGSLGTDKSVVMKFLNGDAARLTATISANQGLLPYRRATLEECLDVARKLKPAERCDTPIPVTPWKTNSDGSAFAKIRRLSDSLHKL
jgi:hypothetical protein